MPNESSEDELTKKVLQKVVGIVSAKGIEQPENLDLYLELCRDITSKLLIKEDSLEVEAPEEELLYVVHVNGSRSAVNVKTREMHAIVLSLLDEINYGNLVKISKEFISHRVSSDEWKLEGAVAGLYESASSNHERGKLIAILCKAVIVRELDTYFPGPSPFSQKLVTSIWNEFRLLLNNLIRAKENNDPVGIIKMWANFNLGCTTLIGHLFCERILDDVIIERCLNDLLRLEKNNRAYLKEEEDIIYAGISLLKICTPHMNRKISEGWIKKLKQNVKYVTDETRSLIEELEVEK